MSVVTSRTKVLHYRLSRTCWPRSCSIQQPCRFLHSTRTRKAIKPFLLADVGEGITECQVIQWFVQPGARVEEFDKICEVQSDKASVEITSPYAGVIKRLHYDADDMAITGKPLLDIDTEDDVEQPDTTRHAAENSTPKTATPVNVDQDTNAVASENGVEAAKNAARPTETLSLATPAVRHLLKELNLAIESIKGTGKDGRVLREDVLKYADEQKSISVANASSSITDDNNNNTSQRTALTPVQSQMFKTMSKSLSIPHFLYTSSADMSAITKLRKKMQVADMTKVTAFAFILKAVSIAFRQHPLLNASLDLSEPERPALAHAASHDFGIAIDTPSGLVVPVIRRVQNLSIEEIANKVKDISDRARNNALAPSDFSKASFTLSNIGAIGGGVVSPVITAPQVAIVGIGRSKVVPAFDEDGELYRREELVLSWSADHRVVDGAECARCAEHVRALLESPASMILAMR